MNRLEPDITLDYLLNANVSSAWAAIAELSQLKEWYLV